MPSTRKNKKKGGAASNSLSSVDNLFRAYNSDYYSILNNLLELVKEKDILITYKISPDIANKLSSVLSKIHQISIKMENYGHQIFLVPNGFQSGWQLDTAPAWAVEMTNVKKNKFMLILNNLETILNKINSNTDTIYKYNSVDDRFTISITQFNFYNKIIFFYMQLLSSNLYIRSTSTTAPAPKAATSFPPKAATSFPPKAATSFPPKAASAPAPKAATSFPPKAASAPAPAPKSV